METAGSPQTINQAIKLVRFRGTASCLGQPLDEPIPFSYRFFSLKEVRLLPTITAPNPTSPGA